MKKFYKHLIILCILIFYSVRGESAITSIVLTPVTPPTTMSTGLGYYLAGKAYTFTVNVIDPAATAWTDFTNLSLNINNLPLSINMSINPSALGGFPAGVPYNCAVVNGPITAQVTAVAGTFNNFTATFTVTFLWSTPESVWGGGRLIRASATSSNTLNSDRFVSYGICSTVQVTNLAMTGEAADGMINGLHDTFNVTGDEVVYNIAGATSADRVRTIADAGPGEITSVELRINAFNPGGTSDVDESNLISVDVPAAFSIADNVAPRTTAFLVNMATAGGPETSFNTTTLTFNSVRVTNITFLGGGGIDADPAGYYRSTNVPGTQVRIDAVMNAGGGPMVGNTTIELRDTTDGNITAVTIANGQTNGTVLLNITAPGLYSTTIGANSTQTRSYEIYNVYGGSYGSAYNFGQWRDNPSPLIIPQPVTHSINWDNADYPGANANTFTPFLSHSTTAGSLTVNWTPLTAGFPDGDFDQYKFYFKKSADTLWTVVDKTTPGYTLAMPDITTGTITVSGLDPLTNYDYMVSAIDIFGNESIGDTSTLPASTYKITGINVATAPSSITVKVTDSITTYNDATFNANPDPAAVHRLNKTNIRIDSEIITTGNIPTQVDIVIADNASDMPAQWGSTGTYDDMRTLPAGSYYEIPTVKTGPNTWTGYLPSENVLMTTGQSIRFLLKITYLNGTVYVDHDSELEVPPGHPADQEWRLYIYSEQKFTPWPTRILNNVITDENPIAYPAYYLTDDAYVTIKAYDIKGRIVAILLEDAYRKAGQNIKENGWRGTNKSNKKLGLGLYYIHIKAKRASDGKVIIDKFNKVVMAK